jgi:hypothetical protein
MELAAMQEPFAATVSVVRKKNIAALARPAVQGILTICTGALKMVPANQLADNLWLKDLFRFSPKTVIPRLHLSQAGKKGEMIFVQEI